MQHKITKIAIASVAMMMLSQTGAATWGNHGSHEPDNANDNAAFMWTDPPAAGETKVYFNAWSGMAYGAFGGGSISPNLGTLRTTNEAPTLEYHMAILGVWQDCNGDGYIGIAETAQQEYPAALLLDTTVCPPVTGDRNVWTPGAYNYNGWVTEYIPVGGIDGTPLNDANDSRSYRDPEAMIWGDNGLPDDPATAGGSCATAPQPRGTWQSTGGFLNWIECSPALLERWNEAWNGRRLAGQNVPGITTLTGLDPGLDFENDDDARGTWADHQTFGSEDTAHSPATVWDCDAEPFLHTGTFVNSTLGPNAATFWTAARLVLARPDNTTVYQPDPSATGAADPTAPAFVNSTQEGLNALNGAENCDTSDDDGHDFYGNNYVFYFGETDFNSVSTANKRSASWNLQFANGARDATIVNLPANQGPSPGSPAFGGRAGFMVYQSPVTSGSVWSSPSILAKTGPRLLRTDLNEATAEIAYPTNFTFYAFVGAATTARGFALPGGSGEYASAQCGDNTDGIHSGWNCDPATWYKNPDGSPVPEPRPFARPGQKYQLRDTDCYDGRNSLGVPLGLTAYGASACLPYGS